MSGLEAIFGLAAGGAGLLSLSIQLVECATKLNKIYHAAQDAPRTVARLVSGLEIMAMALQQLEQHRQPGNPAEALLARCIVECQLSTAEIQSVVEKMEGCMIRHARLGGKLYTAFKQRGVKELLDDLERAKSSLEIAYTMYRDQAHGDMFALLQAQILEGRASISQQLTVLAQTSKLSQPSYLVIPDAQTSSTDVEISAGFHQTNNGEASKLPDGAPQGEFALQRSVRRDNGKCHTRARLRFPTWLCRRIFDFALTRAQCGWSVHLRTYNVVENGFDSLIFRYCENGNLVGMRRLFQSGAATPLDVAPADGGWETLLEAAARKRQLNVCRYLLNQTSWPDRGMILSRALDNFAFFFFNSGSRSDMYRLFLADAEFDADLDERSPCTWWRWCEGLESLEVILQNQSSRLDFHPFQTKFEIAAQLYSVNSSDFLRCMAVPTWDHRLATVTSNNGETVLHRVVRNIFRLWNMKHLSDELQGWIDLGISVLRNGADPVGMVDNGRFPSQKTPLLNFFGTESPSFPYITTQFQWMLGALRLWANIIQQAGLDLYVYGARECQVWNSLGVEATDCRHSSERRMSKVMQLVYGANPEDWTVKICCIWPIDVYRLQLPPGSFSEGSSVPTTIAWSPTDDERDEGPWTLVESKIHLEKARDLRDTRSNSNEPFEDLMNTSQDDSDVIMLMQYRALRKSRISSRSHSQPPCLRRREVSFYKVQASDKRRWLECYHLCPFDSTWRFGCTEDDGGYEHQPALGDYGLLPVYSVRSCVKGISRGPFYVQGTFAWEDDSFLACVARCQDQMANQFDTESAEHIKDCPCPQYCRSVRLDQLNVPEDLRTHHPYRRVEDDVDSV